MRRTIRSRVLGCALALATLPAFADETPANSVLAQSLFEQGRALLEQGDYARACPAFAESERLDPGGGTLLNLALCHQKAGKLATAWAEFNEALSGALRDGRKDRETLARQSIAALEPELPHLSVELGPNADAATEVRLDGMVLSAQARGYATPVDPGPHTLSASSPGRRPWSTEVSLAKGESKSVTVPELAPLPAPVPETAPTVPKSVPALPPPAPRSRPEAKRSKLATGSYVSAGVALASFGTAIITGIVALSAEHSAQNKCLADRDYCPDPSYATDASRARTFAWVSTGALGVGVGASVAALLWPRQSVEAPIAASPLGFALQGRF